jgi:hypothetical protein
MKYIPQKMKFPISISSRNQLDEFPIRIVNHEFNSKEVINFSPPEKIYNEFHTDDDFDQETELFPSDTLSKSAHEKEHLQIPYNNE